MIKVKSTLWKFAMSTHWGYLLHWWGRRNRPGIYCRSLHERSGRPGGCNSVHSPGSQTGSQKLQHHSQWFEESTKSQLNSWFIEIFITYGMKENLVTIKLSLHSECFSKVNPNGEFTEIIRTHKSRLLQLPLYKLVNEKQNVG